MTSPHTLLKAWNLRARKELGQNFLRDDHVARRIVELARLESGDTVLEIGAGLGVLTICAAGRADKVIAIEKDRHLVPLLRAELLAHGCQNVQVHEKDILAADMASFIDDHTPPLVVLGNLPYNISSQIVVKLIEQRQHIDRALFMFQKELAERLCAGPGTKVYGRLSVRLQYCADLALLMNVGASQFHPRPKVDSSVIGITFKKHIDRKVVDEDLFKRVIQAAFGQRRKTLRNALPGGFTSLNPADAQQILEAVGIDPKRRAETLSVDDFVTLTNHMATFPGKR